MQETTSIYSIILDTIFALIVVLFSIGVYQQTKKSLSDLTKKEEQG